MALLCLGETDFICEINLGLLNDRKPFKTEGLN
jgi:hypothetical protein